MTAKEALHEFVEGLSEHEAAACLARLLVISPSAPVGTYEEASQQAPIERRTDASKVLALLDAWREEGPAMSEEEWDEFARSFDAHRPHRPLFT